LEGQGVDEKIMKEILEERVWRFGLVSSFSGQVSVVGCCRHGNEPSVSIKGREFFD
jgi:hypothetical protein